jgi:hypothetical protein
MDIDTIRNLASHLYEIRAKKKELENAVKDCNEEIKRIEEGTLNNAMIDLGINSVSLENMDISKSVVFRGGYTKHEDPEAFKFLFDSNNDGALKKHIIVDLEAYPRAGFVLMENDIEYKTEYSIHHATLSSIIKELVETGKFSTDDIEKYSVYVQPQIKIKVTGETE